MQSEAGVEIAEAGWPVTVAANDPLPFVPAVFVREFRAAPIFYALFLAFAFISYAASAVFGDSMFGPASLYLIRLQFFLYIGGMVASLSLAYYLLRNRLVGGNSAVLLKVSDATQDLVLRTLTALVTYVLFMGCFLYWKMKITWVNPFAWDTIFADMDEVLFAGQSAFDALAFLQTRTFTYHFDTAYGFWGIMCVAFWVLVAILPRLPDHVRHQYWLASLAVWLIGGLLLATVFSSAGPIYYSAVTGDSMRFATLDQYLPQFGNDLIVNVFKDMLWDVYKGDTTQFGGISAFPSMHNAQALLFVLVALHMGRVYLFISVPFALLIFISSMHLGWHYAVDAIGAVAITLPIWWLTGRIIGSPKPKPEPILN